MKVLLDTHILLWSLSNSGRLGKHAREVIEDSSNDVFFSLSSAWEISIKHAVRPDRMKINGAQFIEKCKAVGFQQLPITADHIETLDELPFLQNVKHVDPFDRMLISQALSDKMMLITQDSKMLQYDLIVLKN